MDVTAPIWADDDAPEADRAITVGEGLTRLAYIFSGAGLPAEIAGNQGLLGGHLRQDSYLIDSALIDTDDGADLLALSWRFDHPDLSGVLCHLGAHATFTHHENLFTLPEEHRGWAWRIEDMRVLQALCQAKEYLTGFAYRWVRHLLNQPVSTAADRALIDLCILLARHHNLISTEHDEALDEHLRTTSTKHLGRLRDLAERAASRPEQIASIAASLHEIYGQVSDPLNAACMDSVITPEALEGEAGGMGDDSASEESQGDSGDSEVKDGGTKNEPDPTPEPQSQTASTDDRAGSDDSAAQGDPDDVDDRDPSAQESEAPPQAEIIPEDSPSVPLPAPDRAKERERDELRELTRIARAHGRAAFPKEEVHVPTRAPDTADKKLATDLTRTLRKATWRAPDTIKIASKHPPGRLSSRAGVAMAAQKQMGLSITAQPFTQTRRKTVQAPPPIVGLMADTSGSMGPSEAPMSSLSWALARAVTRVGGRFAALTFDSTIKALVKPRTIPAHVPQLSARGTYEQASQAILALTGALGLLGNTGVRVLIISSDARWRRPEVTQARDLLTRLDKAGVHILWVDYTGQSRPYMPFPGHVIEARDLATLPRTIGRVIAKELGDG